MSRLLRGLTWLAALLAVALVAAALVGLWTVRRSFPEVSGELELPGLDGEVTVVRDEWGVPHIYASTAHDLFYAQAFVHSQDRFWQMDVRRHVTAGRIAELFGESELDTDRFLRTLGWRRTAEAELDLLQDGTRTALEDYAEGVNAYLEHHDALEDGAETAELSLEYAVLGLQRPGYTPEAWEPADTVAWLKAMAWDLRGNMESEIDRALAYAGGLSQAEVEELYPSFPYDEHPTIVAGGRVEDGVFVPGSGEEVGAVGDALRRGPDGEVAAALRGLAAAVEELPALLGPESGDLGSNSWVVAGEHTASGAPLLANDPHLGAEMPSLWYRNGLHCTEITDDCPYDVVGYSFAGVPGVVIGHNDRVAWGFTNLGPDVTDLYVERVDGDRYEVDGEWRDMEVFTETIEVAGGDPVEHTIRLTEHGPLMSDVSEEMRDVAAGGPTGAEDPSADAEHAVALRWTALQPGRTADAIFLLNRAGTFDEFRAAAALFEVPSQNLVYADVDGNIGYQAPGLVPIRSGYDGRWPVAGWDGDNDWTGFVDFEELPYELNPDRGYIVTANQAVTGPAYEPFLTSDWDLGYRADRIVELIDGAEDLTVQDMLAVQMDAESLNARDLVPALLEVDVPEEVEPARELLADWDGQHTMGDPAAAFFAATWRHLLELGFADELPEDRAPTGGDRWFRVVAQLLEDPSSAWWDDVGTDAVEDRDDVLRTAMVEAHEELSDRQGDDPVAWSWGELHTLTLTHGTLGQSGIGPIEWLFNRGPYAAAGGTDIVNATGWNAAEGYEVVAVPSMRMVVDLADLDGSRWVDLTGASGHAFHPHYDDLVPLWQDGRTTAMLDSREAVLEAAEDTLTLRPAD